MNIRIDRRAHRQLKDSGGLLTLEARAKTGCMVTRQVEARAGKPEDPDAYSQLDVGGITVFMRGVIERDDGTARRSPGAMPGAVRVGARDGQLTVDVG